MHAKQHRRAESRTGVDRLPDGSERRRSSSEVPELPTQFSEEQVAAIYAAIAHAHFALATLRGADIQFAAGRTPPPELSMNEPGNQRFFVQLTLLGMALEQLGLDPSKPIPLPEVRRQQIAD